MAPLPVHWYRPPQSPDWQWPRPSRKTQPVRPQNRPFQCSGTTMVRLGPGFSVQPVRASGCAGFCAAATQMVWVTRLTNVTRWAPAATAARAGAPEGEAAAGEPEAEAGPARLAVAAPLEEGPDEECRAGAAGVAAAWLTAAARTSAAGAAACAGPVTGCARPAPPAPAAPSVTEHAATSATAGPAAA